MTTQEKKRLLRSRADRYVAGVCGGLAEYLGIDSTIVRVLWVLSVFAGGLGLWLYIAAWLIVPEAKEEAVQAKEQRGGTGVVIGVILILIGMALLGQHWRFFGFYHPYWHQWDFGGPLYWWWRSVDQWLPWLIIVGGLAYIVVLLTRGRSEGRDKAQIPLGSSEDEQRQTTDQTGGTYRKCFTRVRQGRMVAGVCAGLAEYFDTDPALVRLLWVLGTLLTSVVLGVLAYLAVAIIVPEKSSSAAQVTP